LVKILEIPSDKFLEDLNKPSFKLLKKPIYLNINVY